MIIGVIEGLQEMIPLKHIDVLRCDCAMAILIAFAFTTCELGCVVEMPVPRYDPLRVL
jgi:hypothetical protein